MAYESLKAGIAQVIRANGQKEITGNKLQAQLFAMIDSLGAGYLFMGVATPETTPGTPDQKVFYIGASGTYENFGSTSIIIQTGSIGIISWDNNSWSCDQIAIGSGGSYVLPPATAQTLGGVKIGSGINVAADGTISVGNGSFPSVIVEPNGRGDYTTIQAAINATSNGDVILIMPGEYEEAVEMFGKERYLIGFCKEKCILKNGTGNYDTPPLEASIGGVYNMTIIADNYDPTISDPTTSQDRPSYGIHVEYQNVTDYSFTVQNCKVISKWSAAIGAGVRFNQTVNIIDCELISYCEKQWSVWKQDYVEMGGLFFHNDAYNTNEKKVGYLNMVNTILRGKTATLTIESVDTSLAYVNALFVNNTFKSQKYGHGLNGIYRFNTDNSLGSLCGYHICLDPASKNNTYYNLNGASHITNLNAYLINSTFTYTGYWVYDAANNTISHTNSQNWKYDILPVDVIKYINAYCTSPNYVNIADTSCIPIIFLDGSDPLTSQIKGVQYAVDNSIVDDTNSPVEGLGETARDFEVPLGATHVLIQNNVVYGGNAQIILKDGAFPSGRPTRVDNIVDTFEDYGYWEYDQSAGTLTLGSSQNWQYKVFAIDEVASTNACCTSPNWTTTGNSKNIPLVYLDGADPASANVIGVQYASDYSIGEQISGLGFILDPLTKPAGATHILIQNNKYYNQSRTVTVYTA